MAKGHTTINIGALPQWPTSPMTDWIYPKVSIDPYYHVSVDPGKAEDNACGNSNVTKPTILPLHLDGSGAKAPDDRRYKILLITADGFHKVVENIPHPGPYYCVFKKRGPYKLYNTFDSLNFDPPVVEQMTFRYSNTDDCGFLVYKEEL